MKYWCHVDSYTSAYVRLVENAPDPENVCAIPGRGRVSIKDNEKREESLHIFIFNDSNH